MLTIRPATLADLEAIRVVHVSAIQVTCAPSYSVEQIGDWLAHLTPERYERAFDEGGHIVALQDSVVVGFGKLHLASATVNAVYVAPTARRLGVGRRLLQSLETTAAQAGLSLLTLNATLNAERFYQAAGWHSDGPTEHLLPSGVPLPCISMRKVIAVPPRT
jgi:GNAT superfamily N-acetyltransferase